MVMLSNNRFSLVSVLLAVLLFSVACDDNSVGDSDPKDRAGEKVTISLDSTSFDLVYANSSSKPVSFPFGVDDDTTVELSRQFFIAETEVTNKLMAKVLQWAYDQGKFSATESDPNGLSTTTVKFGGQELLELDAADIKIAYDGSGSFSVVTGFENHPLVEVTWYGAIMFCNWLTEISDGNTVNIVYTGVTDTWIDDNTFANDAKTGFRLPSSSEWEFAARYIDGSTWLYGDHVSGDETGACYDDGSILGGQVLSTEFGSYSWYLDNSDLGSGNQVQPVKQKLPNKLGLYDMSGNVNEWCFTETPKGTKRITRVGCYLNDPYYIRVGYEYVNNSAEISSKTNGFRVARSGSL